MTTWLVYNAQAFGVLALGALLMALSLLGAWTDWRAAR